MFFYLHVYIILFLHDIVVDLFLLILAACVLDGNRVT